MTLDQLNRSLEQLERQLEERGAQRLERETLRQGQHRLAQEAAYYGEEHATASQPARKLPTASPDDAQRDSRATEPVPSRINEEATIAKELQALRIELTAELNAVRDEKADRETDHRAHIGQTQLSQLAKELETLREEMRQQLNAARRSLADREPVRGLSQSQSAEISEMRSEIERLTDAVHSLGQRTDERPFNVLRLELEQARAAMELLAREDSVRSIGARWDAFERRIDVLQETVTSDLRERPADAALEALADRVEQMNAALLGLPDTLPLSSLDDKMRSLLIAVEQFVQQQDKRHPQLQASIEHRLDEISRAIVASTVSASSNPDPEQSRRIEARIVALSNQIEAFSSGTPLGEAFDRMDSISRQVHGIASRLDEPLQAVSDTSALSAMESRLAELAQRIETMHAVIEAKDADGAFLDAMDGRFADIASRLDAMRASDEAILGLEDRLATIASRLDEHGDCAFPALDPTLVGSLEAHIAGLSEFLSRTEFSNGRLDALSPRIDRLEETVLVGRDAVVETAREAAERAVQLLAGGPRGEVEAVAGLAGDLKQLESLTRRSDERNAKTFEAIHDTLLKIVDRLGSFEDTRRADRDATPRRVLDGPKTPSIDPLGLEGGDSEEDEEPASGAEIDVQRSPAEAAVAAAEAALEDVGQAPAAGAAIARRSVLRGWSRAFSRKKSVNKEIDPRSETSTAIDNLEAPVEIEEPVALEQPLDPKVANRPLEPGSGAPDLNAIIKRVRDERARPELQIEAEAAKTDFIAAARRAAQAAAAEAEILKRSARTVNPGGGASFANSLKANRKPILLAAAAVMIAIAGFQLGKPQFRANGLTSTDAEPAPLAGQKLAGQKLLGEKQGIQKAVESKPVAKPAAETGASAATPVKVSAAAEIMQAAALGASAMDIDPQESAALSPAPAEPAPAAALIDIPADAGPLALREAAAGGDSKALFEVAARYAEGRGVKVDLAHASAWYEKSAELGFAPAQYRIGNMYEKGNGVARDFAKAKNWYQLAAKQGNAAAMHNLAVLFAMGADGTTDSEAAARWFIAAANLGVKDSQFNLGILSAKGAGVPQSLEESYKWFAIVAKTGDQDAAAKRDEVARSLRPEQLERARSAVELWQSGEMNAEANTAEIPSSWQGDRETTAGIDMHRAISNVQAILNRNGYDAGGPDGVMGERTAEAIKAFQKDNGLQPTGSVDRALVEALIARK